MADRGVYLPCSQFEAIFVSAAMSDEDLAQVLVAADASLASLANAA
jgi:glutamate-1-semialdehyde 2,1-aminomutase